MDNTINSVNFKANIKTLTKVTDKKAFNVVKEEFAKATSKYPEDTLYITRTPYGAYSWHITNKKDGGFYCGQEIYTNSIDKQIEELGGKKFAKKLIYAFKALSLQSELSAKMLGIKNELVNAKSLVQAYKKIASAYIANGKELNANRFLVLSNRNKDKVEKLTYELEALKNRFDNSIKKWSKDFKEINQVEL